MSLEVVKMVMEVMTILTVGACDVCGSVLLLGAGTACSVVSYYTSCMACDPSVLPQQNI